MEMTENFTVGKNIVYRLTTDTENPRIGETLKWSGGIGTPRQEINNLLPNLVKRKIIHF